MQKLVWLAIGCLFGSFICGQLAKQGGTTATVSSSQLPSYFPPELNGAGVFFANYLNRTNEPSFLTAAKESNTTSYRFESLAAQTGQILAVRFLLNPDGSANVIATDESGTPRKSHRKEVQVRNSDAEKFLHLVEVSRFWSMPLFERENRDNPHKVYKMDASTWVFEGVRNGEYHAMLRQGIEPGSFSVMVGFLLRDLARLDASVIPLPVPSH